PPESYTLSLHDALPIFLSFPDIWSALAAIGFAALFTVVGAVFILRRVPRSRLWRKLALETSLDHPGFERDNPEDPVIKAGAAGRDRKSTRLNSSHVKIS